MKRVLPVSRLRLGRIERYVLVQQARSLLVALGVIAALIMLIDFVEISRGVGSDVDLSGVRILGLMMLKSPQVIVQLLPFVATAIALRLLFRALKPRRSRSWPVIEQLKARFA